MRIEFLTQDDPIYILPFFEEFFRHYAGQFEISGVYCCRTMGKRSRRQMIRELSQLYGMFGFGRLAGQMVASRVLSKLPLRKAAPHYYGIEQLCRAYGIPFSRVSNPNESAFVESVRQRGADVLVSVACPYILKSEILAVPPRGCVNIHHAPLPRYKGMMPTFWQLYHGESSVGVTVHYMVPKLDEGTALLQDSLPVETGETLHSLIRRSKRHGAHCMARALKGIETGTACVAPPSSAEGTYFTFPNSKEIREFRRKGFSAI